MKKSYFLYCLLLLVSNKMYYWSTFEALFQGYCWPGTLLNCSFLASRPIYQVGELWNCLIKGTKIWGSPAEFRKGWWRSSAAVALWAGSRTSILSRKPCNLGETWNKIEMINKFSIWLHWPNRSSTRLRSVAGLVIQATGRTEFEDGLRKPWGSLVWQSQRPH